MIIGNHLRRAPCGSFDKWFLTPSPSGLPPTGYACSGRGTFAGLPRSGHEERG
jgi:hypothetical protein